MRTTLNFPQELITSIDLMNTLNGGTIEPVVRLKQFPAYRQLTIHVPGVHLENVKMEINNNKLMVYYLTGILTQGREVQFPKVLYNKDIPYFVDAARITASEEGPMLVLRLPFNDMRNGYHRDIPLSS